MRRTISAREPRSERPGPLPEPYLAVPDVESDRPIGTARHRSAQRVYPATDITDTEEELAYQSDPPAPNLTAPIEPRTLQQASVAMLGTGLPPDPTEGTASPVLSRYAPQQRPPEPVSNGRPSGAPPPDADDIVLTTLDMLRHRVHDEFCKDQSAFALQQLTDENWDAIKEATATDPVLSTVTPTLGRGVAGARHAPPENSKPQRTAGGKVTTTREGLRSTSKRWNVVNESPAAENANLTVGTLSASSVSSPSAPGRPIAQAYSA